MDSMPMIFQTSTLRYEERFAVYSNSIFGNCKPWEVKGKLGDYVENTIRKSGWKAIWSCDNNSQSCSYGLSRKDTFNVLVEVIDVDSYNLTAQVDVCKPMVTDSQLTLQEVQKLLETNEYCIPLTELLPVYDDSGEFDETAIALEHVRFFYDHLWREWDKDDTEDYQYATRYLENRLRLHYDIAQENLSKDFIRTYRATYENYKQKVLDFAQLRKEMGASDSEEELATSDVLSLAQRSYELENIVRSLRTMEDPQMRYLLASANTVETPSKTKRDYPITIIVANQLMAKMCHTLPGDTIIEHFTSPEKAITRCSDNDRIIIHNGKYSVVGCLNLKESVTVAGVDEAIIECDQDEDISMIIQSPELQISGVRFIQSASHSRLLVIEKGKTVLTNCEFQCISNGIVVKRGAELVMRNCKIHGALGTGVTIEENSTVHLEGCEICQNGRDTNDGGIKIIASEREPASVIIMECKIHQNVGNGINIVNEYGMNNGEEKVDGASLQLKGNVIKDNILHVS